MRVNATSALLKRGFLTFVSLISFAQIAAAQGKDTLAVVRETKQIRIGQDPGFFPFDMKKKDGTYVGFDIDMANAFARDLGAKAVIVDSPWDNIIQNLDASKYDLIVCGMTINEERSKKVLFSEPYYRAGLTLLIAQKHVGKIKKAESFNEPQFLIAIKAGTTGEDFVVKNFPKSKILKFATEPEAADAVRDGKADAFVYDKPYIQLYSRMNTKKVGAILDTLLTIEDFGVAARKSDSTLIEAFNAFLKKWKSSGRYEEASKKHFYTMPWIKDFPELK